MARWAPDARGRLELAAMELFGEHGYESTTVAAIAERAGLTERTFFRYYADKREVLFWGARALQDVLVDRVDHAPADLSAIEAVTAALAAAGDEIFVGRHGYAGRRQAVIDANPELQERELIKLASLASDLAEALRRRGAGDPASSLAAEAGVTVFRVAFEEWVRSDGAHTLSDGIGAAADALRRVTATRPSAGRP
jgi:AcrR family transcriptional regulator